MNRKRIIASLTLLLALTLVVYAHSVIATNPSSEGKETTLAANDIGAKLFPGKVFFRGKLAPVQLRNTGGVHFADDFYVLAGLCDTAGYSSQVQEKFQGYLLTEVPLQIGGQTLKAGAYGIGFVSGGQFVVMDLGANNLFQVASARDAEMKRPMPLQVRAADKGGYRLYAGRDYVEWQRAQ